MTKEDSKVIEAKLRQSMRGADPEMSPFDRGCVKTFRRVVWAQD
jgi:hypothetical protein